MCKTFQWVLWCLCFIILAILEYALILGYKKYRRSWIVSDGIKGVSPKQRLEEMSRKLDKSMLVILPPTYVFFAAAFWAR